MAIHRLNHAVLYVRDVARSVRVLPRRARLRGRRRELARCRARRSCARPDRPTTTTSGLFQIGDAAGASGAGRGTRRALPPGLGGRHAARSGGAGRPAGRGRRAGRRVRPQHHQVALRPRPGRAGVRDRLDRARRSARRRSARPAGPRSVRSTWPARSSATAPTRRAASASAGPHRSNERPTSAVTSKTGAGTSSATAGK